MKNLSLLIICSFLSIGAMSQKSVKLFVEKGAKTVIDNDESSYTVRSLNPGSDKGKYILFIKDNCITKTMSTDSIFEKGVKEYTVTSVPYAKPALGKSLKKVKFASFVDKSNKVFGLYYAGTLVGGVSLKQEKYANSINLLMDKNGYNVVSTESEVFTEKSQTPQYVIAAEVLDYFKDTRGTPGFKVSVVLRWSVFDVSEEKVVLKIVTGGYSNAGTKMEEADAFILATNDAALDFITRPEFMRLVDNNSKGPETVNFSKLSLPAVPSAVISESSNYIESSIKSVLTIKTNSGHGSGFVVSSSGFILTNAHVVEDSAKIEGIFSNGLTLPLQLICTNNRTDVALLKIPGSGYAPLSLDTTSVTGKVGSDIVAIGTPEDISLGQSVTKGIISGMRELEGKKYIQTDVSINPGNSGGPLINKKGQVVGIVSRKKMNAEGIGLAIPINEAIKSLNIELKN